MSNVKSVIEFHRKVLKLIQIDEKINKIEEQAKKIESAQDNFAKIQIGIISKNLELIKTSTYFFLHYFILYHFFIQYYLRSLRGTDTW